MNSFKKNLANIISSLRIFGAAFLPFLACPGRPVLTVYTLCGLSDALDGYIARKTRTQSLIGSRLDSIGDLMLYTIMMLKMLPMLIRVLPRSVWFLVAAACILRIFDYLFAAIRLHRFTSTHTIFNKLCSVMMFLIPYAAGLGVPFTFFAYLLSALSIFAAFFDLNTHLIEADNKNCKKIC